MAKKFEELVKLEQEKNNKTNMKKYEVWIEVYGKQSFEVFAENEDDAIEKVRMGCGFKTYDKTSFGEAEAYEKGECKND